MMSSSGLSNVTFLPAVSSQSQLKSTFLLTLTVSLCYLVICFVKWTKGNLHVFVSSDCVETRYSTLLGEAVKHKKLESKVYQESIINGGFATFMVEEMTCTSEPVIIVL